MPSSPPGGTSTWIPALPRTASTNGSGSSPLARPARPGERAESARGLHSPATAPGLSGAGEWLITRTSSGITVQHSHAKADVAVRGPAADLLLVLTRRLPPPAPGLEILGQQALLTHWLQHTPF